MASPGGSKPANIRAYMGGTGTGKTLSVKQYIARQKPARLLLWDSVHEHQGAGDACSSAKDLEQRSRAQRFALRYMPRGRSPRELEREFEFFCMVAWRSVGATVWVEELSTVTRPGYASPSWRRLCTAGRHQRLTIIGTAQRPAQADKDFLGNATFIRATGGFRYARDEEVVAQVLRVQPAELAELPPLHYIERDFGAKGALARGVIPIPGR